MKDERGRHTRCVLPRVAGRSAATGALAVLLVAGCGAAAGDEPAAAEAAVDASSPTAATSADVPSTPSNSVPSDAATGSSTSAGATADRAATIVEPSDALLTPDVLPAPERGFSWAVARNGSAARPSVRLFDPCQPTDYPSDSQRTEVRLRDLRVEDSGGNAPETATVRQNVARYATAAMATEAFAGFLRAAEQCADSGDEDGLASTTEIVTASADRLLLQTTPDMGLSTVYTVVEQRGDVVSLVWYFPGEMRDDDASARKVADAVTAVLDSAG